MTGNAAARPRRNTTTTRTLLVAAAIGVATGLVILPMNLVYGAVYISIPMLGAAFFGIWQLPALLALAVLRLPWAGIVASLVSGVIGIASPWGAFMIFMMAVWGGLIELSFTLTRYRYWSLTMFAAVGAVIGVINCATCSMSIDLAALSTPVLIGTFAVIMISSVAFAVVPWWLARALERNGISRRA